MNDNFSDPYQPPPVNEGRLRSDVDIESFRKVAFWQRYFSVLGYIGTVLTASVLVVQILMIMGTNSPGRFELFGVVVGVGLGITLTVLLYLIPSIRLGAAGTATRDFGEGKITLDEYIRHQKSFWRYTGIAITVVVGGYLGLLAVAFLIIGLSSV